MPKAGWQTKKFSDVLDIRNGRNQKAVESESGTYPILGSAGNVMGYATDYICEAGTTIIGRKGNISTPIYVETQFWNVDTAFGLSPKAGLHNRFLYYYCLSYDFAALNRGTTIPSLVKSELLEIPIPRPPLPEQTRIVAILDEAFANISQAVANAEKNLANARELFDSYLNEVFTRKGEGYKEVTLGKEVSLLTGFPFKSKDFTDKPSDIKLLRGDNVIHAKLRWTDVKRWEASQSDSFKDYALLENDIVIAMDRTWISSGIKYAQLTKHDLPCLLVQRVARLRANDNIDSVFLKFIIGSKMFEQYVISVQTGIGVPHISGGQISAFTFWMPKIKEQQKVAQKLAILEENMQQLEDVYRRKLAALAELKQALLQKAFTGELTA